MKKKIILSIVVLGMTFLLSGCGEKAIVEKGIEKNIEKNLGGNSQVDLDKGSMKIETEQGSLQVGEDVKLPEDFPSDVYVLDGKLLSAMKNVVGAGFQVSIQSDKTMAEVKKSYEQKLKDAGWKIISSVEYSGGAGVTAKKDERTVSVAIASSDQENGQLNVILTVIGGEQSSN